jgi:hypothetical protein
MDEAWFFDMEGNPMSTREYAALFRSRKGKVKKDVVGEWTVSTEWVGQRHRLQWAGEVPLVYQTSVTPRGYVIPSFQKSWETREKAQIGHAEMVAEIREREADGGYRP